MKLLRALLLIPALSLTACTKKPSEFENQMNSTFAAAKDLSLDCKAFGEAINALQINTEDDFKKAVEMATKIPNRSSEVQKMNEAFIALENPSDKDREMHMSLFKQECMTMPRQALWMKIIKSFSSFPKAAEGAKVRELFSEKVVQDRVPHITLLSFMSELSLLAEALHFRLLKVDGEWLEQLKALQSTSMAEVEKINAEVQTKDPDAWKKASAKDYHRLLKMEHSSLNSLAGKLTHWKHAL